VVGGRLVLDEPTDLPDGTEVELFTVDALDDLDEADRRRLLAALDEALAQADRGELRPARDVMAELFGAA